MLWERLPEHSLPREVIHTMERIARLTQGHSSGDRPQWWCREVLTCGNSPEECLHCVSSQNPLGVSHTERAEVLDCGHLPLSPLVLSSWVLTTPAATVLMTDGLYPIVPSPVMPSPIVIIPVPVLTHLQGSCSSRFPPCPLGFTYLLSSTRHLALFSGDLPVIQRCLLLALRKQAAHWGLGPNVASSESCTSHSARPIPAVLPRTLIFSTELIHNSHYTSSYLPVSVSPQLVVSEVIACFTGTLQEPGTKWHMIHAGMTHHYLLSLVTATERAPGLQTAARTRGGQA